MLLDQVLPTVLSVSKLLTSDTANEITAVFLTSHGFSFLSIYVAVNIYCLRLVDTVDLLMHLVESMIRVALK